MHVHAGSTLHNLVNLTFDIRVSACQEPAIQYISTKFGVDRSSNIPLECRCRHQHQ